MAERSMVYGNIFGARIGAVNDHLRIRLKTLFPEFQFETIHAIARTLESKLRML